MNPKADVSEFVLFTGGSTKTPDFAIYYNMAVSNIEKIIKHFEEKEHLLNTFYQSNLLNDGTYRQLVEYLWKAHTEAKNKK